MGGSEGEGEIEGAKAARLECMCCRQGTVRGPHCFLTLFLPHPCPPVPPHRHTVDSLSAAQRFRASAGDVGMSIPQAGVVVWISVMGPAGMAPAV